MNTHTVHPRSTRLCRALRLALLPVTIVLAGSLACSGARGLLEASPSAVVETQAVPSAKPSATPRAMPTAGSEPATGQPTLGPTHEVPQAGFAGVWDTTWGLMTLTVAGSSVSGTYGTDEGRIEGTLSAGGRHLEGTWGEAPTYEPPEHAGRVVFDLSEDGESWSGYWWYGEDEEGGEWAGTRAAGQAPVDEAPAGEAATAAPASPGLTLSSDPDNDLLFYTSAEDGSRVYYYGSEVGGVMSLTHIIVDDGAGSQDVVIYDGRLLPVQWILPTMTVAVYPAPDDEGEEQPDDGSWFDPQRAFHVILEGESERTLVVDIEPGDLALLVDEMEAAAGQRFEGVRGFLAGHDLTFDELVELAQEGGPDQPLHIAAAAGLSAAAAALGLERAGGELSAVPRTAGLAAPQAVIFGDVIKVGAGALGGVLADRLGQGLDPGDGPSVGVLLCRGAAKYGVCHYMFYRADRLGDCITNCQTSLGCFTDICMPMDISAELAMGLGGAMAGR